VAKYKAMVAGKKTGEDVEELKRMLEES